MTTGSDNKFPKVIITEGTAPASPAAGDQKLYIDSSDHHLKRKNSSGTVTDLEAAGGAASTLVSDKKTRTAGDYTTTSATFTDVDSTNLSITLTTGARRCMIVVSGSGYHSTTAHWGLDIDIDGSRQGQTWGLMFGGDVANQNAPRSFTYITNVLTAASHTFKLQWRVDTGTATLYASAGNTPLVFAVYELPLKDPA